jgi:glutaredoxin 3
VGSTTGNGKDFEVGSRWISTLMSWHQLTPPNLSMPLPILYIKRGCPWCDEVVDYLERKNIEVQTLIVSSDREAMLEMVELSGQSKAPTMDWHGQVLADFGVDELVPFLKKNGVV